jgi:hypothetical protein
VLDVGRSRIVAAEAGGHRLKLLVGEDVAIPQSGAHVRFDPARAQVYQDGWLVT